MKIRLCAFADEAADEMTEQIGALKRNGIGLIELRSADGINVKDLTDEKAVKIADELKAAGIKVWSLGSPLGKTPVEKEFGECEKTLTRLLELCKIFDCDKIRVFSFYGAYGEEGEVLKRLGRLAERAAKAGVGLYHENEKEIFGDTALRVEKILNGVRGIKSVYDPANFIQTGETAENTFGLRKRADYYHIKDALRDGTVVPAGEGEGDIRGLIEDIDKDTVLTLEPHLAVFTGYSDIDNTELKNKYTFPSRGDAFDADVVALKNILKDCGYTETDGVFVKN